MADDLGISNHITTRNGVCQYVRRVPRDLRAASPFARIQKSLRTRDPRKARAEALDLDRLWDHRFAEARRTRGLDVTEDGAAAHATDAWTWPDWQALSVVADPTRLPCGRAAPLNRSGFPGAVHSPHFG